MNLLDEINSKLFQSEHLNEKHARKVRGVLKLNGFDTTNFENNIKDLIVCKSNNKNTPGNYIKRINKLVYSDDDSYIHELFHVSSCNRSKSNNIGLRIKIHNHYKLIGIDEGITDYLTVLTGYNPSYSNIFRLCVEILLLVHGNDVFTPYFENDGDKFYMQFNGYKDLFYLLDKYYYLLIRFIEYRDTRLSKYYYDIIDNISKCLTDILDQMIDKFNCKSYIIDKIKLGYLDKDAKILGFNSIEEIYQLGLK